MFILHEFYQCFVAIPRIGLVEKAGCSINPNKAAIFLEGEQNTQKWPSISILWSIWLEFFMKI